MATTTAGTTTTTITTVEQLVSVEDIFHRGILTYLSPQDLGRLECASSTLRRLLHAQDLSAWKILCERDFSGHYTPKAAPLLNRERRSFDTLVEQENWKICYEKWAYWNKWTGRRVKAQDMVTSISLWTRFKAFLEQHALQNILSSLEMCPTPETFQALGRKAPSSLLAFYAVHGGQATLNARSAVTSFFSGVFGSYSCYHDFYSMRLMPIQDNANLNISEDLGTILIGISPGHPMYFLHVKPTDDDPQGQIVLAPGRVEHGIRESPTIIGRQGILSYFEQYINRLEAGVYPPSCAIPCSPTSRGIGLFPDEMGDDDDMVSCCVTRGIEVKASARWFPMGMLDARQGGLNFGYSVRIRMVGADPECTTSTTCQLVGRHWQFMDGNGMVRNVDGEAVIGKQPLFFLQDGKGGYVDLGEAGDGDRFVDTTFVYQSQSGPAAGTSQDDTKLASVQGTFSFVPGSIADPKGPLFHVKVGKFSFRVPSPFY